MYIQKVLSVSNHQFIILLLIYETRKRVMVKLKFIIKDNSLVLRISEGKERYYKSVKHLLTSNPNLTKHRNADKERFSGYAVSYSENNRLQKSSRISMSNFFLSILNSRHVKLHHTSNRLNKLQSPYWKNRLLHSKMRINEIAAELGFTDESHLKQDIKKI